MCEYQHLLPAKFGQRPKTWRDRQENKAGERAHNRHFSLGGGSPDFLGLSEVMTVSTSYVLHGSEQGIDVLNPARCNSWSGAN